MRKLQSVAGDSSAARWGAAVTLGLVACGGRSNDQDFARAQHDLNAADVNATALRTGASCDELLGKLQSELSSQVSERARQARVAGGQYFGGGVFIDDVSPLVRVLATPPIEVASAGKGVRAWRTGASQAAFSESLVQTPGVDEADLVKTDGDRIYVLEGRDLFVLNAASADATEILATIPLEGNGAGLLVHEGRVVVFSTLYGPLPGTEESSSPFYDYYPSYTIQTVIDATSSGFDVLRESYLEGNYSNSWGHAGVVRSVVQQSSKAQLDSPSVSYVDFFGRRRSQAEIDLQVDLWVLLATESIEDSVIEDYLPASFERRDGALVQQRLRCEDYWSGEPSANPLSESFGTTRLVGLDLGAIQSDLRTTSVVGYFSTYVGKDSAVLRTAEYSGPADTLPTLSTRLHRFGFDGAGATYTASGQVAGFVSNLDEREGVIRAASVEETIVIDADAGGASSHHTSTSRIVTLGVGPGQLVELGRTRDVSSPQGFYGTQLIADRAYTQRAGESGTSLMVVDLSDPAAPAFAGEVAIKGSTSMLHPVSNGVLLGFEEDFGRTGNNRGVLLRLYDVSDASAPRAAQEYALLEPGYSEVLYDPHALTLDPTRNLFAFPYQTNAGSSGLEVFRGSIAQGFTRLGRIVPPALELTLLECLQYIGYPTDPDFLQQLEDDPTLRDQLLQQCDVYGAVFVRRGLLRESEAYAISNRSVAAYSLDALDGPPLSQVELPR